MGVSHSARAVLGLEVHKTQLFNSKLVKAFNHNYLQDIKFDPQTGKQLWNWIQVPREFFAQKYEGDDEGFVEGYKVVQGGGWEEDRKWYICLTTVRTGYNEPSAVVPFGIGGDEIDRFTKAMKKHDLWLDNKFGLWALTTCG